MTRKEEIQVIMLDIASDIARISQAYANSRQKATKEMLISKIDLFLDYEAEIKTLTK